MAIREIQKDGLWYKVLVPDTADEAMWQYGIELGPPDLSTLGLPPSIEQRLHNELFVRGLISKKDLRGRRPELAAALMAALHVDAQLIASLYEDS